MQNTREALLLLGHEINSFFVGFTWLLDISKSIPLRRISLERPLEKNVNETKQEQTEQTRRKRPVFILDVILELRSSKFKSFETK